MTPKRLWLRRPWNRFTQEPAFDLVPGVASQTTLTFRVKLDEFYSHVHTLGIYHEHNRSDGDQYVKIYWSIGENYPLTHGQVPIYQIKSNSLTPFKNLCYLTSTKSTSIRSTFIYTHIHLYFQKQDTNNPNTPYDNSSVMHYPIWISSFVRHDGTLFKSQLPTVLILFFSHKMCPSSILGPAFSIENGKDTITPIPNLSVKIGCWCSEDQITFNSSHASYTTSVD